MRILAVLFALILASNCNVVAKTPLKKEAPVQEKQVEQAPEDPENRSSIFEDIDHFFVQRYGGYADIHQKQTRPVVVVSGFKYQLFEDSGLTSTFETTLPISTQLKSIAHLCPCFFALGSVHWNDARDRRWKEGMQTLLAKLDQALVQADQVSWADEAWSRGEEKLKGFAKEALTKARDFAKTIVDKGEFDRSQYSNFAESFTPYMVSLFYLDVLSGTYHTIKKLNEWKSKLGDNDWGRTYFVISGSAGRTTAGLTKDTNPAALCVASLMDPEQVSTRILMAPAASTIEDALGSLGMVLNARDLAEMTFTTPETRRSGGFYDALRTFDVPLATKMLREILRDLRDGTAKDPVLGLGPDKPI